MASRVSKKDPSHDSSSTSAATAEASPPLNGDLPPQPSLDDISAPEIQSRMRDLIRVAKEQDYLTFDDINESLPAEITSPEVLEEILERLRAMDFAIIDASRAEEFRNRAEAEPPSRDAVADGLIEDEEDRSSEKPDSLDDPVRMYLKQMGQVPLLTREEEVEISKRIEKADTSVQKIIHRLGFIPEAYIELAQNLIDCQERLDRLASRDSVTRFSSCTDRSPSCRQSRSNPPRPRENRPPRI